MAHATKDLSALARTDEEVLVQGGLTFHDITELVAQHTEKKTPKAWWAAFSVAFLGMLTLVAMLATRSGTAWASGATTSRSAGAGPLSTSSSGSVSVTPGR
nr:hypothetical protein [Rhodothermus marinus]